LILFSETVVFEIGGEEFLERKTFLLNELKIFLIFFTSRRVGERKMVFALKY